MGRWSSVRSWPSATHVHLLPSGQVMFFGEFESGDNAELWDPAADVLTPLSKAGYNIFCGGHSFLADGTLLVAGGHAAAHVGLAMASLFDPAALRWTRLPDMNDLRWYPTSTTLPSGDALVISGEISAAGVTNDMPQVFEAKTRTWRNLSTAVLKLPYYPREFVARNGKVFVAGPFPQSWYLDTQGTGSWSKSARSTHSTGRDYGPAVLYRENKIAYFGGDDPPTASVEVIDLDAAAPAWRATAPMSSPRRQHNATLLPDGRVLVTGGSSGPGFDDGTSPVLASEVWDPASESFTPWASLPGYRGYHSAALLLPDGRVLSAGGRGATYYSMEVFSPPYLFAGPRPVITRAPEVLDLGQPFQVETPDAGSVSAVNLVRLGSVTHAFDENQRFLPLAFTASTTALTVRSPETSNLAPPGHYMLFVIGSGGVPSVARIVRLTTATFVPPPDVPAPQPPPTVVAPVPPAPPAAAPQLPGPPLAVGAAVPPKASGCATGVGASATTLLGAIAWWFRRRQRRGATTPS